MKFSQKLARLRKSKGWSQEKLAAYVGVSRQAVAKWESGQGYPDVENLVLISDLLKISLDKLIKPSQYDDALWERENLVVADDHEMIQFLIEAKLATYAGSAQESASSRMASHDYSYDKGDLQYRDSYLGSHGFAGQEAVWQADQPVWAMNYRGRALSDGFSGSFLKACLQAVTIEHPYRGPMIYQEGDYSYHCIVRGDFGWFTGYEEIYYKSEKVYECYFGGGYIE